MFMLFLILPKTVFFYQLFLKNLMDDDCVMKRKDVEKNDQKQSQIRSLLKHMFIGFKSVSCLSVHTKYVV